ncbi:MAG: biotin synthase BioB, partial [Nitrososphaerales archaeon]
MNDSRSPEEVMNKVLNGGQITLEDAESLLDTTDIMTLARCANNITRQFNGDWVDVESLINAKSGNCPEDCSFCAQSS